MSTLVERLLSQRKLVLTVALLLSALGLTFWLTMTRQEDPRMPHYWGQVVATFPGADAETVERLLLEPLEDQLAEVAQIRYLDSTAFNEVAVINVELRETTRDFREAWDDVRDALRDARPELPEGASEPRLDDELSNQESIVLAVGGDPDPMVLAAAAERIRHALLEVPGVKEAELIADPGEQITIEYDDATARRLDLPAAALAAQLAARSRIIPGGTVAVGGRAVTLRPLSELASLAEIRASPIQLPGGEIVPLAAVATVRHGPEEPVRSRMRFGGALAVGVGVVPKDGINVVSWGEAVRARVAELRQEVAPLTVDEAIFQPDRVAHRLRELNRSLASGALIVAAVLLLAMGTRLGLVVAAIVPLVVFASVAIFGIGGGELHQISIAALVISLGMLVDNAIVVAEAIQYRLDQGEAPHQASIGAVRELAAPLAGATATTLAAFVPMFLAEGTTSEFTRAIPVVIMLTLTVSYLFAIFVTPAMAEAFLRRRPERAGGAEPPLERVAGRIGDFAVAHPGRVLLAGLALVAFSFTLAPLVRQNFFPSSDRNQLVIDVRLPDGTHLDSTDETTRALERALLDRPEVAIVTSYIGRSTPHFYYNLDTIPWSPHFAQLTVDTTTRAAVDPLLAWVRQHAREAMPEAQVVVRKLEQGPPVVAPVAVRVYGDDLPALAAGAERVMAALRETPGAVDVRTSLSTGAPLLRFRVDDAAAARRGLSRADVAMALHGRTRGLPVGQYRAGDDPVPILVRAAAGENLGVDDLATVDAVGADGRPVPLAQLASLEPAWQPAAIDHRNRRRVIVVGAELLEGQTYSDVVAALAPRLSALELPAGVRAEISGAAETSAEANTAVLRSMPVGVLLLLAVLLAEFRSFRRLGIILVTVPLAAAGVIPGLIVTDQPFGFMSMLGVVALAGVVVNNAIILLEVIEERRSAGDSISAAVHGAVARRVRPILLTTLTTVVGLWPLAVSPSTLWPPLAWTMISGLIASTVLTLLIVPALYLLVFSPGSVFRRPRPLRTDTLPGTVPLLLALLVGTGGLGRAASAQAVAGASDADRPAVEALAQPESVDAAPRPLTLAEAIALAVDRPEVAAADASARAAAYAATAERRAAILPVLTVGGGTDRRDRTLNLETPLGNFPFGASSSESAEVALVQPLLVPDRLLYGAPAARATADAAVARAARSRELAAAEAATTWLDVRELEARAAAVSAFVRSLEARQQETRARVAAGRALEADALKVELALDDARQNERTLAALRDVARRNLARAVGLTGQVVEPAGEATATGFAAPAPSVSGALAQARATRADRHALVEELAAAELRTKATRAEWLPRLEAHGRYVWSNGSPYAERDWVEGGVRLAWNPLAAGTRTARLAAGSAEVEARRAALAAFDAGVEIEVREALAALEIARGRLEVGERGVVQAAETLRVEQERHAAGRITTNDLLAAEAALRDQRTARDVARLALVRARVGLSLALGEIATEGQPARP